MELIFDLTRSWYMDADLTGVKVFDDDACDYLCSWARGALRLVLVKSSPSLMK
jgi:hypothetical protein